MDALADARETVEKKPREIHDWSDRTVPALVVLFLFDGGLAITVLGLLVVLSSSAVADP